MSRPLPALVMFLALSFVLISFATDVPLPITSEDRENVTIGDNQTEVSGDAGDEVPGTFEGLFLRTSCVLTLGITEIFADTCSRGFAGVGEALSNITIVKLVTEGMGSFVALMGALMTFNVPGAPGWVRFLVGTPIIGTIGYIVISLVRGAG